MQKLNFFTNSRIGILMVMSAVLSIGLMLLHPETVEHDPTQNNLFKWVHGIMIFLLIINAYGLGRFSAGFYDISDDTKLGLLFNYIGLGAMIAAVTSGFVQTSLIESLQSEPELFSSLNKLTLMTNQAYAKLGVIAYGAAGVFLLPIMKTENTFARLITLIGGVIGIILISTVLSGTYLNVTTMTILTVLIMVWHGLIGLWLANN